jgi:hypothetical protein
MLEKVANLFIGTGMVVMGVEAFYSGGHYSWSWGRYIDYGPWPKAAGTLFVIVGVILVYTNVKRIIRRKKR